MSGELLARSVAARQTAIADARLRLAFGTVTATSPSLQVALDGSTAAATVKRMASYGTPVIGDYVAVLVAGNDRVVLGKVT